MHYIEKLRPDEMEQLARNDEVVRSDTSCWNNVGEGEFPVARLLTRQGTRVLILGAGPNHSLMRLLREVGNDIRQAQTENRSAVICIVVEDCGTSPGVEPSASLRIEKGSMTHEGRQLMDGDCCCPACCG